MNLFFLDYFIKLALNSQLRLKLINFVKKNFFGDKLVKKLDENDLNLIYCDLILNHQNNKKVHLIRNDQDKESDL